MIQNTQRTCEIKLGTCEMCNVRLVAQRKKEKGTITDSDRSFNTRRTQYGVDHNSRETEQLSACQICVETATTTIVGVVVDGGGVAATAR